MGELDVGASIGYYPRADRQFVNKKGWFHNSDQLPNVQRRVEYLWNLIHLYQITIH